MKLLSVVRLLSMFIVSVFYLVAASQSTVSARDTVFCEQNSVLYSCVDTQCSTNGTSSVQLPGNDNVEKAMNYLMEHGFTLEQAAGIVGNFQWESGSESLDPEGSDGVAFGIAQWQDDRRRALEQYGGATHNTFDTQLHFLGVELGFEEPKNGIQGGTETSTVEAVKAARTPEEAALIFERKYERSADEPGSDGWIARQANARKLYEKYKNGGVGQTGSTTPASATPDGCNGDSTPGRVNADGYAWPIALNQQEVNGSWPCQGSCHHDGTAAFDLAKKEENDSTTGTGVIAIYNGTIQRFNNSYSNKAGCQAFQLVGDDGWWYWYGHLQASSVQNGTKVTAGQQISTVGRRDCTGNGSYPHLHIDRGSPKGHFGGDSCCRDSEFVPLMNKLYDELGGGGVNPRDL